MNRCPFCPHGPLYIVVDADNGDMEIQYNLTLDIKTNTDDDTVEVSQCNPSTSYVAADWSDPVPLQEDASVRDFGLELDNNNTPHVVYNNRSSGQILYMTQENGDWTTPSIVEDEPNNGRIPFADTYINIGSPPSIAIDNQELVHVAYVLVREQGDDTVYYATRDFQGEWQRYEVKSRVYSYEKPTIFIDDQSTVHRAINARPTTGNDYV